MSPIHFKSTLVPSYNYISSILFEVVCVWGGGGGGAGIISEFRDIKKIKWCRNRVGRKYQGGIIQFSYLLIYYLFSN